MPLSSIRPNSSEVPRCGQCSSKRPMVPLLSRKATRSSPRMRRRRGRSPNSSDEDDRMPEAPQVFAARVSGPTRVSSSSRPEAAMVVGAVSGSQKRCSLDHYVPPCLNVEASGSGVCCDGDAAHAKGQGAVGRIPTERQMAISQTRLNTSRGRRRSNYRLSHRRMNPSSPCGRKITIAMKMRPTGIR